VKTDDILVFGGFLAALTRTKVKVPFVEEIFLNVICKI
jgi:hypothetical protein